MEIAPIFIQNEASQPLDALAVLGMSVGLSYLVVRYPGGVVRSVLRWAARRPLPPLPSMARAFLALGAPAMATQTSFFEHLRSDVPASPRFETSEYPPPRSLVRAGEHQSQITIHPGDGLEGPHDSAVHPGIHPSVGSSITAPLFPRAHKPGTTSSQTDAAVIRGVQDLRRARRASEHVGRADKDRVEPRHSHYAVLPGDTLWDIAGKVLETEDMREIARYWPRIHRENRDIIGADPNLLRPGQVLTLPRAASA